MRRWLLSLWIVWLCAYGVRAEAAQPTDRRDPGVARTIVFGADENFPPFSMLDPITRKPTGFEVELIEAIAEAVGLHVEVRLGPWEQIRQGFLSGEIDVVELWDVPTRRTWALFGEPFAAGESAMFVRTTGTRYRSINELGNTPVGVERGALSAEVLRAEYPGVRYVEYSSGVDAVIDVAEGRIEVAITGRLAGEAIIRERGLHNVMITGAPLHVSKISFCVRPGGEALLAEINKGLSIVQRSGAYSEIRDRWIGPAAESRKWVTVVSWIVAFAGAASVAGLAVLAWNASLRRQVSRQTAALEKALASRRQAEEAAARSRRLESLGKITGRIAHDVNNVLTAVVGTAHLLRGNPRLDVQERNLVDGLLTAADQGASLTRQLVAFSHGTLGRRQLVDLGTLIGELPRSGLVKLPPATDLSVSVPETPFVAFVDPSLLEQLVVGLIAAAADVHEPEVCELIEIDLRSRDATAFMRVQAVGRTIDPGSIDRLFDPLESRSGTVSALGPPAARSLALALGGEINVETEHSRGVVFLLSLPLALVQHKAPAEPPNATALWAKTPQHAASAPATALVVEDNAGVRQLLVLQLTREKYDVIETDNGAEAIRIADGRRIDLLVTDVVLPGRPGQEVIRRVRERHPEVAVVLISGYAEHAAEVHAVLESRDRILAKPFGVAEFERAVSESMGHRDPVHTPNV